MKNIILTGGHGFLGKRVANLLKAQEAQLTIPSHADCDLRFSDQVDSLFSSASKNGLVDCVIHAAATVGGIGATASRPADFIADNLMMDLNVIRAAHIFGAAKVVLINSVCAYPAHTPIPFNEANLWEGYPEETNAPYGIAKRTLGAVLSAYKAQYGMQGANLILSNLYGPGDNFSLETSHVIPALILKMHSAKTMSKPSVTIWGTGKPSRDFLYVQDAAEAVVMAAAKIVNPMPINIGTGEEINILWTAQQIAHHIGYEGKLVFDSTKPDGQMRRAVDISRAKSILGWQPQTKFKDGLQQTVEWFMKG